MTEKPVVKFTPSARKQFLNALTYIRRDKPSAAMSFRERTEASLSRLSDFPDSGRIIPEFPGLAFREVIVTPYRFFYRPEERTIWIVGVWHSSQLPGYPK